MENNAKTNNQTTPREISQTARPYQFSYYKAPITNTLPSRTVTPAQVHKALTGPYYQQRTQQLRAISNPRQARHYKATHFDYCTFSGIFATRNDRSLLQHTGLLTIDFDHLHTSTWGGVEDLRKALLDDPYFETQLLFVSPSGHGLKWIIPIDTQTHTHARYFDAVASYIRQTYHTEVDRSGRDLSRACFLPYDPKAYINPQLQTQTHENQTNPGQPHHEIRNNPSR